MLETTRHVPLVDTHAHVFRRDLPFIPGATHHFNRDFTIEDYVAALDANGVRYGVVVAASFLGTYNEYTMEALARHDRLRGTVILEPDVSDAELARLDAAGVVGLRFSVGNKGAPPDIASAEYQRFLGRLDELGWHVHFFSRPEHTAGIIEAVTRSGIRLVVDHFGARDGSCDEDSPGFKAIVRALENERTWVKLSAPYWSVGLDHRRLTRLLLDAGGPERLVWGSDWPFTKLDGQLRYASTIDWLHEWLSESEIHAVDRAAIDLYRFPPEHDT